MPHQTDGIKKANPWKTVFLLAVLGGYMTLLFVVRNIEGDKKKTEEANAILGERGIVQHVSMVGDSTIVAVELTSGAIPPIVIWALARDTLITGDQCVVRWITTKEYRKQCAFKATQ